MIIHTKPTEMNMRTMKMIAHCERYFTAQQCSDILKYGRITVLVFYESPKYTLYVPNTSAEDAIGMLSRYAANIFIEGDKWVLAP